MTDFFANLEAPLETERGNAAKAATLQMANGGNAETAPCPACKGRGTFISYTGRSVGNCFKCSGKGKVGKRVAAAAKGKETEARNAQAWAETHRDEIAYVRKRAEGSAFYASIYEGFLSYSKMTDRQLEIVREDIADEAERIAAYKAKRDADAPVVELSAINALFDTAKSNGLKKPKFRAPDLELSLAPAHGANAGALYVTKNGEYFGKIKDGKFFATKEAPADLHDKLVVIAKDPLAVGVAYGKLTGLCCCCGRELTDPVSVENGIGPICAEKWGL